MTTLSVNVNKIATLRNARGKNNPDVLQTSLDILRFGAHGITVHPRPDGRHIRFPDVYALSAAVRNYQAKPKSPELNIEGYPSEEFLKLIKEALPHQCTLVPDPPHVLTSNAGWAVGAHRELLSNVIGRMNSWSVRVSVFIDPFSVHHSDLEDLKSFGCHRIELFTEAYAEAFGRPQQNDVTKKYQQIALMAKSIGLGVNAGHDLDSKNLRHLLFEIPYLKEVSIGHALVCDSLYFGLEATIKKYLACFPKQS